jgi:hypothetical protein
VIQHRNPTDETGTNELIVSRSISERCTLAEVPKVFGSGKMGER